jgi:hypothetical protein
MNKKLLLLFLLMSGISYGQITITHSDFESAFSPGATYLTYATELGAAAVSVFVGEPSSTAQEWDFTGYTYLYYGKSWGIVPSEAPLLDTFPSSNIVLLEKTWILGGDTMLNWNYKELLTDRLLIHGISDETSVVYTYDPAVIHTLVPFTYGLSWIRERDSTSIMPGYYVITEGVVTTDAFGTMKLPSGDYPCIRLTQDSYSYTHTPFSDDTSVTRGYHFYGQGLTEVNMIGIPKDQFNATTVDVNAIKYSIREGQLGINDSELSSRFIKLDQNCPNPFNLQTVIRYNLASGGMVMLRIYDFLGKEVVTPVNEVQSAGAHQVIFNGKEMLPGVYYYQLTCGDYSVTKKMLISK